MNRKQLCVLGIALFLLIPQMAFGQEERTLKRKVAIGRFTNETQYAKGIFYDRENDPMRKQALDILSSKLAASGKFILLEREDLDVLVAEAGSDLRKIGADYIILGSITEFGRKAEGNQRVFSSSKTQTAEATVSIRLVETTSGLIVYSDEAKGFAETTSKQTMGIGGTAGYDATLSDKAISAALSQLVENIINKCMDKPWRSYILSLDGDVAIMSGGQTQGIMQGDTFSVYMKGKSVVNPQTGIEIELPGSKVGNIEINSMYGDTPETEISFGTYTGQPLDTANFVNYYITEK